MAEIIFLVSLKSYILIIKFPIKNKIKNGITVVINNPVFFFSESGGDLLPGRNLQSFLVSFSNFFPLRNPEEFFSNKNLPAAIISIIRSTATAVTPAAVMYILHGLEIPPVYTPAVNPRAQKR